MHFQYLEPRTLKQASAFLEKYGNQASLVAGGTDLMVKMKRKILNPDYVIDLEGIPNLDSIKYSPKSGLTIGALTKISTLEYSPLLKKYYPVLSYAAGQIGSIAIRNLATLGGNVCNAAPSADTVPALICLQASARTRARESERIIPLECFFLGPGLTCLEKGEILVEIALPPPQPDTRAVYIKHSPRGAMDLAVVGVAVAAVMEGRTVKDIRLALGAVAPTPMRARQAEDAIRGQVLTESLIKRVAAIAAGESSCITDVRGSSGYRQEMVEVFTRRALKTLIT
jgi:aerobic carbon-monoxide dehydrogenase medium subunit